MTSADVKTGLTSLKGWWGSLSRNNTQGMEVFMVRAQGIAMAHCPIFRLPGLFFFYTAANVKQTAARVCGSDS